MLKGCQELAGGITQKHLAELRLALENAIRRQKEEIMKTQAELAAELKGILAQQKKSDAEIRAAFSGLEEKIAALETVIANGEASPELTQAVADVKAQEQILDDLVPDAA